MSNQTRRELLWILAFMLATIPAGYCMHAVVDWYVSRMPLVDSNAAWKRRHK